MNSNNKIMFYFSLLIIVFSLASCSSVNDKYSYAIRIKKEQQKNYSNNPYTGEIRNGNTLKGRIFKVSKYTRPDSCPITETTGYISETYVYFIDSLHTLNSQIEKIPIEHIDFISNKFAKNNLDYGKINIFEKYNNPLKPDKYTYVKYDSIFINPCNNCDCNPIDLNIDLDLDIKCPKRLCSNYFIEVKGLYAVYNDYNAQNVQIGRDNITAELAGGFRIGREKKLGIGVAVNSGIKVFDTKNKIDLLRPTAMLHFRYDFLPKCLAEPNNPDIYAKFVRKCISPFAFAQVGTAFDSTTLNLIKLNLSTEDCKSKLSVDGKMPDINLSFPLSFSIGAGADFPILPWFDLSADISFRSYAVGETIELMGYSNIPINRRINFVVFRFGVTF